jgi:hypothetical protein
VTTTASSGHVRSAVQCERNDTAGDANDSSLSILRATRHGAP